MTLPTIYDDRITSAFYKEFGFNLDDQLLFSCYVGSQSHGTTIGPLDDIDIFAVLIPPASHILGLYTWDNWVYQFEELDVTIFSLSKWISLLLKQNPNVLGTLWLKPEFYHLVTPQAKQIFEKRDKFSSIQAYYSFSGYAKSKIEGLKNNAYKGYMGAERKKLVDKFGYDVKNAAHLIRLYRMGIEFCKTGVLEVYRPDREELISIKKGEWSLERVQQEADSLSQQMELAKKETVLHERPDFITANTLAIEIHKQYLLK